MYEIDNIEDFPDSKGLAFLIHLKDCVPEFKTYSKRVIKMKVNLQGKDSVTVIQAYTPIEDEKVEQFYDDIERPMADCDSKYMTITGDFIVKMN